MKNLLMLMFVVGFSFLFSACREDPLIELQPTFDLPDVKVTDGEDEENEGKSKDK
ncbi:MAG: hypothetical protein MI921_25205 [Cytophagales bacterium]|nr:hypothetical protein [Cytophagales bacterium]